MSKKCCRCGRTQAQGAVFGHYKYSPDGLRYACKACSNATNRLSRRKLAEAREAQRVPPPPAPTVELLPSPSTPTELPKGPLEQAYEAHKAAQEKRDLRKEHGALLEENESLRKELSAVRSALHPPEVIVYKQPAWERSDAVACAVASDWHVEEQVVPEAVHGLNEYNLDVARSRAEHFFKNWLRLADILARETKITTLFLAGLGDFFSGWIHEELLASTLLAPGDAARFCKGLFVSGIDYILRESSYAIEGVLIPGNHGRMTEKLHFSDPTGTSLESVMYDSIRDRYHNNPRVRLEVSEHAMRYRRFFERFTMRLIHGYEVKYGGGVGGITVPIRKALAQWNNPIRADLTVMGHFHQFFDGGDFLVNGSLIGYSPYSQAIKASFEEPRQAFFLVHARKGGQKSVTAPIWLDDKRHERATVEDAVA